MKVSKETWLRTAVLAVALVNQLLTAWGKNPLPFSNEAVYEGLSAVVTTAAFCYVCSSSNFCPSSNCARVLRADSINP